MRGTRIVPSPEFGRSASPTIVDDYGTRRCEYDSSGYNVVSSYKMWAYMRK